MSVLITKSNVKVRGLYDNIPLTKSGASVTGEVFDIRELGTCPSIKSFTHRQVYLGLPGSMLNKTTNGYIPSLDAAPSITNYYVILPYVSSSYSLSGVYKSNLAHTKYFSEDNLINNETKSRFYTHVEFKDYDSTNNYVYVKQTVCIANQLSVGTSSTPIDILSPKSTAFGIGVIVYWKYPFIDDRYSVSTTMNSREQNNNAYPIQFQRVGYMNYSSASTNFLDYALTRDIKTTTSIALSFDADNGTHVVTVTGEGWASTSCNY